jgi:uncharacterized protein DUF2752
VAALGAVAAGAAAGAAGAHAAEDAPTLCPCRLALGVPCPFCGLTHSLLAVGHGDLGQALALNPLGWVVPLVAVGLLLALTRSVRSGVPIAWPRPLLATGTALVAISWIVQLEKGV